MLIIEYHLSRRAEKGDIVNMNSLLGLSGESGYSTGPHLHYEIRAPHYGRLKDMDALSFDWARWGF